MNHTHSNEQCGLMAYTRTVKPGRDTRAPIIHEQIRRAYILDNHLYLCAGNEATEFADMNKHS